MSRQIRALRKLKREYPETTGKATQIGMPIHPHMLRHSTGFYLANKGVSVRIIQDYLGHKNIQHTVRYSELASNKFEGLWDD